MWNEESHFQALFSAGQWDQAERLAAGALERAGDAEGWLMRHALCCIASGRFADGLQSLDRAVCVEPRSLESLLAGSVVLADLGFYDEASKRYEAAVALRKENAAGPEAALERKLRELARAYLDAGKPEAALEEARKAVGVLETGESHALCARILMALGRHDDALGALEKARRAAPHLASLQVTAAVCHVALRREKEAREALRRAEELQDSSRAGHVLRRAFGLQ